jgi:hypothetical protein
MTECPGSNAPGNVTSDSENGPEKPRRDERGPTGTEAPVGAERYPDRETGGRATGLHNQCWWLVRVGSPALTKNRSSRRIGP